MNFYEAWQAMLAGKKIRDKNCPVLTIYIDNLDKFKGIPRKDWNWSACDIRLTIDGLEAFLPFDLKIFDAFMQRNWEIVK